MKKIFSVLIILCIIGCKHKTDCTYTPPIDKQDGLKISTLTDQNLNMAAFQKVNRDICDGIYGNIHSVLVIHQNELIVEQYYNGWDADQIHFLASTTKSFSAIMIGIAIEQGKIKDENQKMLSFFPEYASFLNDTLKNKITIQHLLTNTSGFKWDEVSLPVDDPNNMGYKMDKVDNLFQASIELPMAWIPGTKYTYSGPNNIILGEIIKAATGQNIAKYAESNLFAPLGIKEYKWFSKNGIYDVGGGLQLKTRDIAKYALLHLNKGEWDGKQIVTAKWIEKILSPYI